VICLQLYDAQVFSDRISGVTLDALTAGSPIVTTANTWIARMVLRFDAGLVVQTVAPEEVLAAIERIRFDFARYQAKAHLAGLALRKENCGELLYKALSD